MNPKRFIPFDMIRFRIYMKSLDFIIYSRFEMQHIAAAKKTQGLHALEKLCKDERISSLKPQPLRFTSRVCMCSPSCRFEESTRLRSRVCHRIQPSWIECLRGRSVPASRHLGRLSNKQFPSCEYGLLCETKNSYLWEGLIWRTNRCEAVKPNLKGSYVHFFRA